MDYYYLRKENKMKKSIILILALAALVLLWYFFAPIKWTFGFRKPKNYNECLEVGGKIGIKQFPGQAGIDSKICDYNGTTFAPTSSIKLD